MAFGTKCCNTSLFCKKLMHLRKSPVLRIQELSCNTSAVDLCTNESKLVTTTKRYFSRKARKSWFGLKRKSYDIVDAGDVGAKRLVPDYIKKPSYADTGIEVECQSDIKILNHRDLECMQQSCSLARIVLDEVARYIEVGITTDELDAIAHATCLHYGAYPSPLNYRGFPKSICTSVNNVACHGIPDDRRLKDGDIISVDVSVFYNGFHGDCASSYCVGNVDPDGIKLVRTASLCLKEAINICRHGQEFRMIGKTISKFAREHGCEVIPSFCGHGIGSTFHCPPNILHYENEENGKMTKGMVFTIEPVICDGQPDIVILEDGWTATTEDNSRSAQFEHTILITDNGSEILTVPNAFKGDNQLP